MYPWAMGWVEHSCRRACQSSQWHVTKQVRNGLAVVCPAYCLSQNDGDVYSLDKLHRNNKYHRRPLNSQASRQQYSKNIQYFHSQKVSVANTTTEPHKIPAFKSNGYFIYTIWHITLCASVVMIQWSNYVTISSIASAAAVVTSHLLL